MESQFELQGGCLRIYMPQELDHHSAQKLRQQADEFMDAYIVSSLVFDFRNTEFMDSSGIGILIGRCKNMNYSGGSVKALNMNERVRKLITISGLQKLMELEEEEHV